MRSYTAASLRAERAARSRSTARERRITPGTRARAAAEPGATPRSGPGPIEEAELSKSSLHGPVYRDRMLAYFERDDVSPLLPPPAPLIAPKIAERRTLVSCLRAADEVPDDAFWEGRFERLSTPRRAYT